MALSRVVLLLLVLCTLQSCLRKEPAAPLANVEYDPFLDSLSQKTFNYFWDLTNRENGLVPDRWPSPSFSSIAATGFGLTTYLIGVERGYIKREEAAARVLTTLRFFQNAPKGDATAQVTGNHGFFYHFLDMKTGMRFREVELSTIDTGLLIVGRRQRSS